MTSPHRQCRAPGCSSETSTRFSHYCNIHRARLRRHGAIDQSAITKPELVPYIERVRARARKNINNPAWSLLEARWQGLGHQAQSVLAFHHQGRAGLSHERRAAQEVVKLATSIEPREAVETILAMVMMWDMEPRRFRTDGGFRSQLVRRVRGLADMNVGVYFDDRSGRAKRVYRDLPPRAVETMADWIVKALGGPALQIARLEVRDREAESRKSQDLQDALADLK